LLSEPDTSILDWALTCISPPGLVAAGMLHFYATNRTHRHRPPEMHSPEHGAPYL
jgi:hypothetical protein